MAIQEVGVGAQCSRFGDLVGVDVELLAQQGEAAASERISGLAEVVVGGEERMRSEHRDGNGADVAVGTGEVFRHEVGREQSFRRRTAFDLGHQSDARSIEG